MSVYSRWIYLTLSYTAWLRFLSTKDTSVENMVKTLFKGDIWSLTTYIGRLMVVCVFSLNSGRRMGRNVTDLLRDWDEACANTLTRVLTLFSTKVFLIDDNRSQWKWIYTHILALLFSLASRYHCWFCGIWHLNYRSWKWTASLISLLCRFMTKTKRFWRLNSWNPVALLFFSFFATESLSGILYLDHHW